MAGAAALVEYELTQLLDEVRSHLVTGTWADITVGSGMTRTMTKEARLAYLAKRPVQKLPRGAVYFLGKLLTLGIRTTEVQGWKRQSLTTNCGY